MLETRILEFLLAHYFAKERTKWSQYLTDTQHSYLVGFLDSWSAWTDFTQPKFSNSFVGGDSGAADAKIPNQEQAAKPAEATRASLPYGALTLRHFLYFRVMCMIKEQLIPYTCLNDPFPPRWVRTDWSYIFLELEAILGRVMVAANSQDASSEDLVIEEVMTAWISDNSLQAPESRGRDRGEVGADPHARVSEMGLLLHDMIIDDMYYTLEDDVEDSESEVKRIQMAENNMSGVGESMDGLDLNIVLATGEGAKNGLKYLLAEIDRKTSGKTNRELKSMIFEAKPSRSKWASDERVGQEELYDACEKVLSELKGYSEHSLPFLTKVNKRDAPDYYDIIKNPMDLGTMSRNLKALQYKSKDQFVKDLYLIYTNCFTYNTAEASIYRVHAKAMREKTDKLVPLIPNITIRSREEFEDESDVISSTNEDETESMVYSLTQNNSISGDLAVDSPKGTEDDFDELDDGNDLARDTAFVIDDAFVLNDSKCQDLQVSAYKLIVGQDRLKYLIQRYRMISQGVNSVETTSITRSEAFMKQYCDQLSLLYTNEREAARGIDSDLAQAKEYFLPEIQYIGNCIPESVLIPNGYNVLPVPLLSLNPYVNSLTPSGCIHSTTPRLSQLVKGRGSDSAMQLLRENIDHIKSINIIRSKIDQVSGERDEQLQGQHNYEDEPEDEVRDIMPSDAAGPSDVEYNEDDYFLNEETALQVLERFCGLFLMHCGFDGCSKLALQLFSEVFSDIFLCIGKTIKHYYDNYAREMTFEEIISHSFQEAFDCSLDSILQHHRVSIVRYGSILRDVLKRLEAKYESYLVDDDFDGEGADDDNDFDAGDVALLSGNFGEDLGVDFLGFKELGLGPLKGSKFKRRRIAAATATDSNGLLDSPPDDVTAFNKKYDKSINGVSGGYFPKITTADGHIGIMRDGIMARLSIVNDDGLVCIPENSLYKPSSRVEKKWFKKSKNQ